MAAGATYEPIATQTLASAATSITFSSIPATYTDLRLVFITSGSGTLRLQLNSDTGTNYSQTYLYADGTSAISSRATSATSFASAAGNQTIFNLSTFDFFSYAGATNKTFLNTQSADQNGSGSTIQSVGLWRNTSAINTVYLFSSANFNIGSIATLYGIKAA